MRTVAYGGAVSLDGFLAGPDGALDWLHFSKDVQDVIQDYCKDVDTILMGRKTYEMSVAQRGAVEKTAKTSKRSTEQPVLRSYVFSRTLPAIDGPAWN